MTDRENQNHANADGEPTEPPTLGDEVIMAMPVADFAPPPPVPELPRLWTAFIVSVGSIVVAAIFAGIVFAVAMFTIGGAPLKNPAELNLDAILQKIAGHPLGLWVMVLPGQICFFAAAITAAYLSPTSLKKRLKLVRGDFPPWTWIIMAAATPAVSLLISMLFSSANREPSEQLKAIEDLVITQGGARFFITALLIAVAPGICEELVFRGYLQTRLLERWSARAAIIVSAAIFALAHIDPMHAIAVFPLGVWLGVVAWRTGSILPAMLCHFTTNFFALLMSQFGRDIDTQNLTSRDMMIFGPCLLAMIVCITLFVRERPRRRIDIA